jgi:hypothetical protein
LNLLLRDQPVGTLPIGQRVSIGMNQNCPDASDHMQEEQRGRFLLAHLPIENFDSANIYRAVSNDGSDGRSVMPFWRWKSLAHDNFP